MLMVVTSMTNDKSPIQASLSYPSLSTRRCGLEQQRVVSAFTFLVRVKDTDFGHCL